MIKPDGHLTDDLNPNDQPPRDACGVFGVWSPGEEVAKLAYFGLYALQHRGQESAGIAVSDGSRIVVFKDMGLVPQVFDESVLNTLRGHIAVGHCRYSTSGSSVWQNAQPTFRATPSGSLALGHNGNLINTLELAALVSADADAGPQPGGPAGATSDTDVLTALFTRSAAGGATAAGAGGQAGEADQGIEAGALAALPLVRGAYSLVFMDERTLYAARDPQGFRPLVLGAARTRLGGGQRDRRAGHRRGLLHPGGRAGRVDRHRRAGPAVGHLRPGRAQGLPVRVRVPGPAGHLDRGPQRPGHPGRGRPRLAAEHPVEADLVIPVPESGTPAAIGYAQASGIPYGQGLVKNSYVGRTFIQPSQTIRQRGIRLKLNPLRDVIAGQRVVVVDDSIVRGNTQRAIVAMLREAGAAEVHVRISSPPVAWPCFYGIDFATRAELIAGSLSVEEIRLSIGADTLGFTSTRGTDRRDHPARGPAVPGVLRR